MAQFSGAIKIADGFDDYLAPAQNCVLPLASKTKGDSITVSDAQDELEFTDFMVAVDIKSTKRKAASTPVSTVEGANFGQINNTADKATITLNDCLACSGCVTSAETILITQQSTDEFQRILSGIRDRRAAIAAGADEPSLSPYRAAVVSISPQSLASIAELFSLPLTTCADLLDAFFRRMGASLVVGTVYGQHIALTEAQHEFEQRYINRLKAASVDSLLHNIPSDHTSVTTDNGITREIAASHPAQETLTFAQASAQSTTLPLLCSECPGWTVFAEKTQGDKVLGHMSSVKSPMELTGMLVKDVVSCGDGLDQGLSADDIYHASITPCYDKKLEAARQDYERGRREDALKQTLSEPRNGDNEAATSAVEMLAGADISVCDPLQPSRAVDVVLATSELADMMLGLSTVVAADNMTMTTRSSADARGRAWWAEVWRGQGGASNGEVIQGNGEVKGMQLATPLANVDGNGCCGGGACGAGDCGDNDNNGGMSVSGYATPSAPLTKLRVPGTGSSGNYAEYIFRTTAQRVFDVTIPEETLPWCAGTNSDLKAVSLEYLGMGSQTTSTIGNGASMADVEHTGAATTQVGIYALIGSGKSTILSGKIIPEASATLAPWKRTAKYRLWRAKTASTSLPATFTTVDTTITLTLDSPLSAPCALLWVACAQGFRNVQNVIKQGPAAPNYDYVEVLACPSGCSNGGGQIRAVDMPRLRTAFAEIIGDGQPGGVAPAVTPTPAAAPAPASAPAAASVVDVGLSAEAAADAAETAQSKRLKSPQGCARTGPRATPVSVDDDMGLALEVSTPAAAAQPSHTALAPASEESTPVTPAAIALDAGTSLQVQKSLVSRIDAAMNTLPVSAPADNALLQRLYAQVWGGRGGRNAVLATHTHFRALDATNNNLLPKW